MKLIFYNIHNASRLKGILEFQFLFYFDRFDHLNLDKLNSTRSIDAMLHKLV